MKLVSDLKPYFESFLNSWPAKFNYFLNGWILRFTEGVTARANSVLPMSYNGTKWTLGRDINIVETAYKSFKLPPIFMMHDFFKPKYLEQELIKREYVSFSPTDAMMISINDVNFKPINENFTYVHYSNRVNEFSKFLAKHSTRSEAEQIILEELSERIFIPKKRFFIAKDQNEIIGTLMGVLDPNGFLYLADLLVDPKYRNQNVATSLYFEALKKWAISKGVRKLWLQVEVDNKKAINFYKKFGFKKIYSYYYLKKEYKTL